MHDVAHRDRVASAVFPCDHDRTVALDIDGPAQQFIAVELDPHPSADRCPTINPCATQVLGGSAQPPVRT